MIKISLNDTQAVQQLHNIARQLQQPRKLYGVLGETLKKIHAERFKQEVDPQGNGWQPLSAKTLARKQKKGKSTKILRQDGYLSDKTAYNYNDKNVEFGSDAKYARLHQFGGKAGRGKMSKNYCEKPPHFCNAKSTKICNIVQFSKISPKTPIVAFY